MADIRPPANAAQAIAATALRAEQARMRIIAENIANANSTSRTPGGDPYRRQVPVFEPMRIDAGQGVEMVRVTPDRSDFKLEYDPGHPSADAEGYVKLPNVNTLIESLDMKAAQRAYEANLTVIETARAMQLRTLDLIRK
ncbi:MAG: flagellar basal body rod protein FlgC [Phenylobacterium sp.]|jgi:flagellar basal-body rod protein FlgC|uniref:flagellar basal body rod protein FlgC n=1 Tax=Phenylobacterium sp. TaxID=1871053 RepID=UPI0025CF6490|nr:flagellar basal body rod protein FlgC [Phenylobacterium sp.]MCA3731981.1 flagellar basal body rod protein FlgC [Phenylobacterium sp.]MCA3736155.1 flagellar basal body rod protein FlgC [Phenylobacterium sp.]MCA3737251.1 flagellar basal body rod protein FlgC [Phenylobacterium sp.]MCA4917589.1 flagellar basal body rod protein FlgC [Phenylobacterium sp.]MCA6237347.1 flagellar basal body rod protein FlgC [Phenylobacterium sp.]